MEIRKISGPGHAGLGNPMEGAANGQIASAPAAAESGSDPAGQDASPAAPFADPLLRSLVQARLDQGAPTAPPLVPGNILYTEKKVSGAGSAAPVKASASIPADVASLLDEGAKIAQAKAEFTGAQKAIAAGDYAKAYGYLESLMRKQGEEVLEEGAIKATQTVRDQLEFLSKMQRAGINADYPPTQGQLEQYFKTLSNNPAAARQAFYEYADLFHVHPGVLGSGGDIVYSKDKNTRSRTDKSLTYGTAVPDNWSEVVSRPSKDKSKHIGKQVNDCEGFAFMAEKLLAAAGFKLAHHVTAFPGPGNSGHSMVSFTHAKEKGYTVTSNHYVVQSGNEKAAAKEALKTVQGAVTDDVDYFIGKTMLESQIQMAEKDRKL